MKLKYRGFTILESILVVVVIAAMSISVFIFLNQYTEQRHINITVERLQRLQQATMDYFITNNETWPTDLYPTLSDAGSIKGDNDFVNAWGGGITKSSASPTVFVIQTTVPSDNLARKVASKFVNASAVETNVLLSVSVPGQYIPKGYIQPMDGDVYSSPHVVTPITCPPGTLPGSVVGLSGFSVVAPNYLQSFRVYGISGGLSLTLFPVGAGNVFYLQTCLPP